jgi:hypothetical protein
MEPAAEVDRARAGAFCVGSGADIRLSRTARTLACGKDLEVGDHRVQGVKRDRCAEIIRDRKTTSVQNNAILHVFHNTPGLRRRIAIQADLEQIVCRPGIGVSTRREVR